jgi:hypothetical protein
MEKPDSERKRGGDIGEGLLRKEGKPPPDSLAASDLEKRRAAESLGKGTSASRDDRTSSGSREGRILLRCEHQKKGSAIKNLLR